MLFLKLTSVCVTLTTMFFGVMHSRWPPADWWPSSVASIWSSLQTRLDPSTTHDNESSEFPRISEPSRAAVPHFLLPFDDGQQPRLSCSCRLLDTNGPTRLVEDTGNTYSKICLIIFASAVAFVLGLCFIDWVKANCRFRTKTSVSETPTQTSPELRSNSTTPERGRPLHRTRHAANSLIYHNKQADNDFFARPVEVKKWIIRDDSTSARGNGNEHSTIDPASRGVRFGLFEDENNTYRSLACFIPQAKEDMVESEEFEETEKPEYFEEPEVDLPEFLEAVSSANTGISETHRPVLFEEPIATTQDHNQPTELFDDPKEDILIEPLNAANPAATSSSAEAESPTALFENTIAQSRTVLRVEYGFQERVHNEPPPPSNSLDAASPMNETAAPTERQPSFNNTTASSKSPATIYRQHLADKFKELENYQPGGSSSSDSSSAKPPSSTTTDSASKEDGDMMFHFQLDGTSPSPPASRPSSASGSGSPSFGGFQDGNGHWNIDHASTLPFGAKSGKKRRTRRRPRKGRARQKLREEAEADAAEAERSELFF